MKTLGVVGSEAKQFAILNVATGFLWWTTVGFGTLRVDSPTWQTYTPWLEAAWILYFGLGTVMVLGGLVIGSKPAFGWHASLAAAAIALVLAVPPWFSTVAAPVLVLLVGGIPFSFLALGLTAVSLLYAGTQRGNIVSVGVTR